MKFWLFSAKPALWGYEGNDFNLMLKSLVETNWSMSSFKDVAIGDRGVIKIGKDEINLN